MLRDIVYGTDEESQAIGQIFADWRYHTSDSYVFDKDTLIDKTLMALLPIAQHWAGNGTQSKMLLKLTKKLLLADNPDRAEKVWRSCIGPKAMRHWGGMWLVARELWFGKGAD